MSGRFPAVRPWGEVDRGLERSLVYLLTTQVVRPLLCCIAPGMPLVSPHRRCGRGTQKGGSPSSARLAVDKVGDSVLKGLASRIDWTPRALTRSLSA